MSVENINIIVLTDIDMISNCIIIELILLLKIIIFLVELFFQPMKKQIPSEDT